MTAICWVHVVLFSLCCLHGIQPAAYRPIWMSPKFPCDVRTTNTSKISFNCYQRNLKKVPQGIPSNATGLNLEENHIQSITHQFASLSRLDNLNLNWLNGRNGTSIDAMAFRNLTKLRFLGLTGNRLTKIPSNLPSTLISLQLGYNKITFLDNSSLNGIKNVEKFIMVKNCYFWNPCGIPVTIKDDSFKRVTKLKYLELSYNNITRVPKGLPPSLKVLMLASNRIQNIFKEDFIGLPNLRVLKLQGNCPRCGNAPFPCVPCVNTSISIHPRAFANLRNLTTLHLGGNSLKSLETSWFESLTNLQELYLSFNLLQQAVVGDVPFLSFLTNLVKLDLSFNFGLQAYPTTINLSKNFSKLVSLRTLHLEALVFQDIGPDTLKPLYELQNLSVLNLGTNFIVHCNSSVFRNFANIKLIYLKENRLYPVVNSPPAPQHDGLKNEYNWKSDIYIPRLAQIPHGKDFYFEVSRHFVKPECWNTGRVLVLSSNNLFFISPKQFEGYSDIACLNLSRNGFSAALNGTEFTTLPNLTYLDLSYNKIDLAYSNAFAELKQLEVLDLSYNEHYFKAYGITHNLQFLQNLPSLRVLNMSYNSISKLTTKRLRSKSLNELQFHHNELGKLWKEKYKSYDRLFSNLTNLTILDISYNFIDKIPISVFENLPRSLILLRLSHNRLDDLNWAQLKGFHQLEILDLSNNYISHIPERISNVTHTLRLLDLSNNKISHLSDGFLRGAKSLKTLNLSYNQLAIINQSTFLSGPENHLETLFLDRNPFPCTCDLLDFILWIEDSDVKIPRLARDVMCEMQSTRKHEVLIMFDISRCVNDNMAFLISIFLNSLIIISMFAATTAHLFYWDASYVLHYLKAKLKGYHPLTSLDCVYDVFVTYDITDPHVSEWVMGSLRVKLEEEEGEKHLPLCLEERDWTPGVPLIDNLSQSIRYSRKTLFVLTEAYVKTGAFKMAMYLAHQRLLDDNEDVIVLLMLEPVLQQSHFLRLRQRLCGKSVVEWPRTAAAEPWFWQNLRTVVRVDNQVMYNKTYIKYFTNKLR
ncbi:toll-like receptor 8 [Genypterus blacodes]|uniref:toll-like receptor 8 n=1 Tax=Genypterus blacodes TaxID=154954 RepID=UPI003F7586F9